MKIPMYNKGMGQAVATPAGKVSPRADIGTFAAPAQAAAQFANQVGQVAFQFGMAEKKRETDRVSNEEAVRIQSEADDLILNNQDTETAVFSQNFKKFETKKLAEIDRIKNLTNSQRDAVKARVSRIMLSKAAAGKQNTFNRGQAQSSLAANEVLDANINEMGTLNPSDPRYKELYNTNVDEINKGVANGLTLNYTETSMKLAVSGRNYYNNIESANSTAKLDAITENLKNDKTLPVKTLQALLANASARERVINSDNLESAKGNIADIASTASPDQLTEIAKAYTSNKPITIELGGQDVTIDPSNLTSSARLQMGGLALQFHNQGVAEITDNLIGRIGAVQDNTTQDQLKQAAQQAMDGNNFTITDDKGVVGEYDISQLPNAQKIKIASALNDAALKLDDTISNDMIVQMNKVIGSGESPDSVVASAKSMYDPVSMSSKGQKASNVDAIIYDSADQTVDGIARQITENKLGNVPEMLAQLKAAEALLTQDFDGRGAFSTRIDSLGDNTQTTLDKISTARKNISKAINAQSIGQVSVQDFMNKRLSSFGLKESEKDAVINAGMSKAAQLAAKNNRNAMDVQFDLLEGNNVVYKPFKERFGQASSVGRSGVLEEGTPEFQQVQDALVTYNAMGRYPAVQNNHTTEADRTFFDAVNQRLPYETLEQAMINVSKAAQKDIDVTVPLKAIEQSVRSITSETEGSFFVSLFTDQPTELQNKSDVQQKLKNRALDYVRLGVGEKEAVEAAKQDMVKSHVLVRGILTPKTVGLPDNINEMANRAVAQSIQFRDEKKLGVAIIAEDELEASELSIVQGTADPNVWVLVRDGGIPVQGAIYSDVAETPTDEAVAPVDVKFVTWTTTELKQLLNADAAALDQARIDKFNNRVRQTAKDIANGYNIDQSLLTTGAPMYTGSESEVKAFEEEQEIIDAQEGFLSSEFVTSTRDSRRRRGASSSTQTGSTQQDSGFQAFPFVY